MVLLLYYKKPLADAINEFGNFWSLSLLAEDTQQTRDIQTRLKLYKMAMCTFVIVGVFQIFAFIGVPILTPGRNLPYAFWLPNDSATPYYQIVFLLEVYALYVLLSTVIGADSLFIAFCGSLAVQFKLLAHKFRNMRDGEGFKECVEYHQYLLRWGWWAGLACNWVDGVGFLGVSRRWRGFFNSHCSVSMPLL